MQTCRNGFTCPRRCGACPDRTRRKYRDASHPASLRTSQRRSVSQSMLHRRASHGAPAVAFVAMPLTRALAFVAMRLTPVASLSVPTLPPSWLRCDPARASMHVRSHESCSPCLETVRRNTSASPRTGAYPAASRSAETLAVRCRAPSSISEPHARGMRLTPFPRTTGAFGHPIRYLLLGILEQSYWNSVIYQITRCAYVMPRTKTRVQPCLPAANPTAS
jgi:hypothetical protein